VDEGSAETVLGASRDNSGGKGTRAWVQSGISLNLRASSSTQSRVLTVLAEGTEVTILSQQHGWALVRTADDTEGWCKANHLTR
jgi:uncharacterized protein YgiM (DUF1202 family)